VPYWGGAASQQAIADPQASTLFSEVSFMWYGTSPDGSVPLMASASTLTSAVRHARASGLPVIPTIFDSSATGVMRAIIHDPVRRAVHVQRIVDVVTRGIDGIAYDGIDLDYEVFAFGDGHAAWPSIAPDWVAFVTALGDALHARGKLLTVTVPPVWNGGSSGYTVYSQKAIAPAVDRLRLMVYDWSQASPGPMAPAAWVQSVLAYSSTQVPTSKLQLGIPAYGREWTYQKVALQVCPDRATFGHHSIDMSAGAGLAAAHRAVPRRDPSGELTFAWDEQVSGPRITPPVLRPTDIPVTAVDARGDRAGLQPALRLGSPVPVTCTVRHVVYVPDAVSMRASVDAALRAHWSGAIVWALGYENTALYRQLGTIAQQRAIGSLSVQLDAPVVTNTSAAVTGVAFHPEFDLPLPVVLTLSKSVNSVWTVADTRTITARASHTGLPAGIGPFHGIAWTYPSLPVGTYQLCAKALMWAGATTTPAPCRTFDITAPAV
jgi:hypothetical protein